MGEKPTKPERIEVYRRKKQGDFRPRLGTPSSVQPGDLLTFNIPQRGLHSRYVAEVHTGHCVTQEMRGPYGLVDSPRTVAFSEFYSAERSVAAVEPVNGKKKTPTPVVNESTPVVEAPEPIVEDPPVQAAPKKKKPAKKKPPVSLLEFLDPSYRE